MGTSLSGLTPATTFDGLLKTSDNEPLDGTLKAISTGDGTDTILSLSNSALSIGGSVTANEVFAGTSGFTFLRTENNARAVLRTFAADGKASFYNAVKIGDSISPTAQLQVVGSGATSATTSLLVQNSAGSDVLTIKDDRSFKISSGAGTVFNIDSAGTQTIGTSSRATSFNGSQTTFVRDVGIGETTPTARLHLKGSGNDNTTTSLLVQNSDGIDMFKVLNGGATRINTETLSSTIIGKNGTGGAFIVDAGKVNNLRADVNGVAINSTPSANTSFKVKGSGATSATTALLVQNSAGTDMLKVQDDGIIQAQNLKINASSTLPFLYAENNTNKSLKLGNQAHLSAFSNIQFKTYDGSAYSEAMRITGNTDQFVGIGESTPTARLHVKGSGNDNTTTSLLVQNSDTSTSLTYDDSGELFLTGSKTQITLQRDGGNGGVIGNNNGRTYFGNSSALVYLGGKIGINQQTPTAQLQVKGSGATSATTALLVQNSAGTDLFKVRDDGDVITTKFKLSEVDNALYPNSRGDLGSKFSTINHFKNAYLQGYIHITQGTTSDSFSTYNASAKLQVDSTTQGFLPPRMTTTERDAISTPAAGLMVYNTDTNTAECWNGSAWMAMF